MTLVLRPYREILAQPGALSFSAAGGIARLPMSMTGIGIVLLVSAVYGSYGLAGTVAAVNVAATATCSPQVARLVDRHGQARIMRPLLAVAVSALAGLVVAATLQAPPWVLYVTAAGAGATLGSIGAMARARWTHLLPEPHRLHTAYSLESALDDVVFAVGPVAATLLATSVAPGAGLVVALVAATVGGYWFLAQRRTEPPVRGRGDGSDAPSAIRSAAMLALIAIFTTIGGVFGATNVATVAFAEEQDRTAWAGPILAVFAVASVFSGLLYGSRHWTSPMWRRFLVGVVALAAGTSLFVLVETLWQLALVMSVAGCAIAPTLVTANGLIQRVVPPARLTEGLTWGGTALGIGVAIGSSAAGRAIDAEGARAGYAVVVVAACAGVVLSAASIRTFRRRAGH